MWPPVMAWTTDITTVPGLQASTWPVAASGITDISMASSSSTDHRYPHGPWTSTWLGEAAWINDTDRASGGSTESRGLSKCPKQK